ncbi:MAG: hypothetical protein H6899_00805 [Rhodobacter sp.]|nr:hypothetical protein [Paracoccaceae bacterium]MCC0078506.1 hypothetical protein [Rhodobacter sp.]
MDQTIAEKRAEFVAFMGQALEGQGLSPISGRILGLLMFDGTARSFSDLATDLGVSRGSVSINARTLIQRGLVEKFNVGGDRQDYFRVAAQPYEALLAGISERMRHMSQTVGGIARSLPDSAAETRTRLSRFANFHASVSEGMEHAAKVFAERFPR